MGGLFIAFWLYHMPPEVKEIGNKNDKDFR
jgi:hypothetical protein